MAKSIPEGCHTVTPRIVVHDAEGLVTFLKQVFGAAGDFQVSRPSEMRIGVSKIMVSGTGDRDQMTAFLYVYVDDVDETYSCAVHAGATWMEEPRDVPYGDRRAMVRDQWGNTWQIATHKGDL